MSFDAKDRKKLAAAKQSGILVPSGVNKGLTHGVFISARGH
jgi:hypothetical protein